MTTVGERIRELRETHHISLGELAEKADIGKSTLIQIEKGRYPASGPVLVKLADYFNVSVDYILGRVDQDNKLYKKEIKELYENSYLNYLRYSSSLDKIQGTVFQKQDPRTPIATWPYNLLEYAEITIDSPMTETQMEGFTYVIDNNLTTRESSFILCYFMKEMTLEAIGNEFGITRERGRQIIARAVRKIKHPSRLNLIKYGLSYPGVNAQMQELDAKKRKIDALVKEIKEKQKIVDEKTEQYHLSVSSEEKDEIDILYVRLSDMDLSVRSYNALNRAKVETVSDIIPLFKSDEIMKIRNLGRKSAEEIRGYLVKLGVDASELQYDPEYKLDDSWTYRGPWSSPMKVR